MTTTVSRNAHRYAAEGGMDEVEGTPTAVHLVVQREYRMSVYYTTREQVLSRSNSPKNTVHALFYFPHQKSPTTLKVVI